MDLNRWVGVGCLVDDPQMVGGPDGANRITYFIITNKRGRKGKEYINHFNCVAYTGLADLIYKYCKKGDLIGLDGEWKQKIFFDKKAGLEKEEMKIVAYAVQFLTKKNVSSKESQEDFENLNSY